MAPRRLEHDDEAGETKAMRRWDAFVGPVKCQDEPFLDKMRNTRWLILFALHAGLSEKEALFSFEVGRRKVLG